MFEWIIYVLVLIASIIFELYWLKNDKKQILVYIDEQNGKVVSIEKVSWYHTYKVEYHVENERYIKTVHFTFAQDGTWY